MVHETPETDLNTQSLKHENPTPEIHQGLRCLPSLLQSDVIAEMDQPDLSKKRIRSNELLSRSASLGPLVKAEPESEAEATTTCRTQT